MCDSPAALRTDGACEKSPQLPPVELRRCLVGTNVTVMISVFRSPEVPPAQSRTRMASPALAAMLHGAVAVALRRPSEEVVVAPLDVTTSKNNQDIPGTQITARSVFMMYELVFSFCTVDTKLKGKLPTTYIKPRPFEQALRAYLERFRAFASSSVYVFTFEHFPKVIPVDVEMREPNQKDKSAAAVPDDPSPTIRDFDAWIAVLGGIILITLTLFGIGLRQHYQRKRRKQWMQGLDQVAGAGHGMLSPDILGAIGNDGAVATAIAHFSPECLATDEAGHSTMLSLEPGDIIQVISGDDTWLCGHMVGLPDCVGYFPTSHITWVETVIGATRAPGQLDEPIELVEGLGLSSAPDTHGAATIGVPFAAGVPLSHFDEAVQGFVGTVIQVFSADQVDAPDGCLLLAEGEVVLVSAGSDGWLFGEVVGMPERQGYFPQSCIAWLSSPDTSVQA